MSITSTSGPQAPRDVTHCYRHPTRETAVSCSSCGRPICTECMHPTPVGMRCPECARETTRTIVNPTGEGTLLQDAPVTAALIAVNVVVFIVQFLTGTNPIRVSGGADGSLLNDGAFFGPLVADGEWWRIVSSGFMHLDLIHVGLNMALLFFLGRELEPALGRLRFTGLYIVSLVAGSLGIIVLEPEQAAAGASGAVFGLMGAALLLARSRGINPMESGIGGLIIFNLVYTFAVPNISKGGHIGGLVGGLVIGFVLIELDARRRLFGRTPYPGAAIAIVLAALAFYATIAVAESEFGAFAFG